MASPPERITVKRPRDEDPVEALFIQQKKQRPSCYWKLVDHDTYTPQYAAPTASVHEAQDIHTRPTAIQLTKVPTVRTTLPSEDNEKNNGLTRSMENPVHSTHTSATIEKRQQPSENMQPKKARQNTHDIFASTLKARKFHLIRGPSPISSPFLVQKTIAQKHRDKRKKDLAVFAEKPEILRKAKVSGDVLRDSIDEPRHVDNDEMKDTSPLEQPRKRPNATAAERKWRTETWANPPKPNAGTGGFTRTAGKSNEPSNQGNYESARLAEKLQEVALEEFHASEERAKGLGARGQLKIKTKPPRTRQPRTENLAVDGNGDDLMTNALNFDNEGDYVIDTYVRSSAQPFEFTEPANPHYEPFHGIDHSNIGILVIEDEEEEALWEAFAEDRQSDQEWNSEEEDENAEDYYGNDYPEEEVDSDDEFGRGAYIYRHAASDDEEFGSSDE